MNEAEKAACEDLERYREQLLREAELRCRDPLHELKALREALLARPTPKREQQPPGEHAPADPEQAARLRHKPVLGAYSHHYAYKHIRYAALDTLHNNRDPERGELLSALQILHAQGYEEHYLFFRERFTEAARSEHYESPSPEDLEALEQALPLSEYLLDEDGEAYFVFGLWPLRRLIEGSWWHDEESWSRGLQSAALLLLRAERQLAALGYGAEKSPQPLSAEAF